MKTMRHILMLGWALMASLAFATAEDAVLVTLGTQGPDRYADGTLVADGECYALVWQARDLGAVRFTAEGEVADGADAVALRVLPIAKDGRCPKTAFAVEEAKLPKLTSGKGCLRLYLLDTRNYTADGAVSVGRRSVQSSAPVTASVSVSFQAVVGNEQALAFATSVLGGDVGAPRITAIRVLDEVVELTVANTDARVNYAAANAEGETVSRNPVTGGAESVVITIPRDRTKKTDFFRVKRDNGGVAK